MITGTTNGMENEEGHQRGLPMGITWAEVVLGVAMIVSLVLLHLLGEHAFLSGIVAMPPLVLPMFFVLPLCQAFLRGVPAVREVGRSSTRKSFGAAFPNRLRQRLRVWLALWGAYFIILEGYLHGIVGGGSWVVSVSCATTILFMTLSCFIWSSRCRRLWPLILLTLVTTPFALIAVYLPVFAFVYFVGPRGYMDLGLIVLPPLGALVLAGLVTTATWFRFKRSRNARVQV